MARSWGIRLLLTTTVCCVVSCDSQKGSAPAGSASHAVNSAAEAPRALPSSAPPLASDVRPLVPRGSASVANRLTLPPLPEPARVELTFLGKVVASALVPVGEKLSQPVLVVLTTPSTHDQCKAWESIKPKSGFFLCPSPKSDAHAVLAEFKLAIRALNKQFGKHVGPRSTLVGYGSGADAAAALMRESPILFPRGFLIGGGVSGFSSGAVQAFAAQGGERVLFACKDCEAGRPVSNLLRSGLAARHVEDASPAPKQLLSGWEWLSEGDPWW